MKKILLMIFSCVFLFSCAIVDNTTRLRTAAIGLVYNSVANKYMSRPTTLDLVSYGSDEELQYRVEGYSVTNQYGLKDTIVLFIPRSRAEEHEAILRKFLEWDKIAQSRGDMITKELGVAKTVRGNMIYTFHATGPKNILTACFDVLTTSSCSTDEIAFDRASVLFILSDIEKLKNGQFQHTDLSVYQ